MQAAYACQCRIVAVSCVQMSAVNVKDLRRRMHEVLARLVEFVKHALDL